MTSTGPLLFVDESKQRAYLMAAGMIAPREAEAARRALRRLLMPGQTSVHFRSESERRRKQILDVIASQGWSAHIVVSRAKNHREARDACLQALVALASSIDAPQLVIETDDSLVSHDRKLLFSARRRQELAETFEYTHRRRREEPCLWVPDAIAWAYARGGPWRARIQPLLAAVTVVD